LGQKKIYFLSYNFYFLVNRKGVRTPLTPTLIPTMIEEERKKKKQKNIFIVGSDPEDKNTDLV
jgi:hypothetical protein